MECLVAKGVYGALTEDYTGKSGLGGIEYSYPAAEAFKEPRTAASSVGDEGSEGWLGADEVGIEGKDGALGIGSHAKPIYDVRGDTTTGEVVGHGVWSKTKEDALEGLAAVLG